MTPEGEISEIPYPTRLQNLLERPFARVHVLRPGLLVVRTGDGPGEAGMFLLREDRIIRFWGRDKQVAYRITPSPDGCRIAFTSWSKNKFGETPKMAKIIDVCRGEKK
jgi:hypothetical protein